MKVIAVMTTTDSVGEARRIADVLVERGLAACVQVSVIDSVYRWKGATQHDQEYRVFIKTTRERYPDVEAAILESHSYDLPAIYALELDEIYEPYADWVRANVGCGDD